MEGIHVEDIFELVSLVLSLIISWTFRILAYEEDQYTYVLSIALEQTKAGPLNSGTAFLVTIGVYRDMERAIKKQRWSNCGHVIHDNKRAEKVCRKPTNE